MTFPSAFPRLWIPKASISSLYPWQRSLRHNSVISNGLDQTSKNVHSLWGRVLQAEKRESSDSLRARAMWNRLPGRKSLGNTGNAFRKYTLFSTSGLILLQQSQSVHKKFLLLLPRFGRTITLKAGAGRGRSLKPAWLGGVCCWDFGDNTLSRIALSHLERITWRILACLVVFSMICTCIPYCI